MALSSDLFGDDVSEVNLNEAENALATHGAPPEGVYHAMLDSAGSKPLPSGNAITVLKFVIVAGPHKGKKVEEELWPVNGGEPEKAVKQKNRNLIFAHRLGWLNKDKDGRPIENAGKHGFIDCIGTLAFIDVKHKLEKWTNKKGEHQETKKAVLAFEGILNKDDKRTKDVPVGKAVEASKPTTGKPTSGNAAPKGNSLDDI